jgi:hypothetical protein
MKFELIDADRYYPPNTHNLNNANIDIEEFRKAENIMGLLSVENALAEASRIHTIESGTNCPNPYMDFITRASGIKRDLSTKKRYAFDH